MARAIIRPASAPRPSPIDWRVWSPSVAAADPRTPAGVALEVVVGVSAVRDRGAAPSSAPTIPRVTIDHTTSQTAPNGAFFVDRAVGPDLPIAVKTTPIPGGNRIVSAPIPFAPGDTIHWYLMVTAGVTAIHPVEVGVTAVGRTLSAARTEVWVRPLDYRHFLPLMRGH